MTTFPPPFVVSAGSRGQVVTALQRRLNRTGAALAVDGVCGPRTMEAAGKALAIAKPATLSRSQLAALGVRVLFGIDLSGHTEDKAKGRVDCDAVHRAGVDFVYEKLTQGEGYFADECARRVEEWKRLKMPWGVYHFLEPEFVRDDKGRKVPASADKTDPERDGAAEAAWFRKCLAPLGVPSLPIAADLESGLNRPGSRADDNYNVRHAIAFLDAVSTWHRPKPMVYTGDWAEDAFTIRADPELKTRLAGFPLWLASYDANPGIEPRKQRQIAIWPSWAVWQFSGSYSVPGVPGRCDVNWALAESIGID